MPIPIDLASWGAANAAGLVVSTGVIPLSGILQDVQITGWLHVVVQYPVDPIIPTSIHANLPAIDVVATDSSGATYLAYGAGLTSLVCQLNDSCTTRISGFTLQQVKRAYPVDPILPVSFNLRSRSNRRYVDTAIELGDVFPSFAVVAP